MKKLALDLSKPMVSISGRSSDMLSCKQYILGVGQNKLKSKQNC